MDEENGRGDIGNQTLGVRFCSHIYSEYSGINLVFFHEKAKFWQGKDDVTALMSTLRNELVII